jgi:hypothetical protein
MRVDTLHSPGPKRRFLAVFCIMFPILSLSTTYAYATTLFCPLSNECMSSSNAQNCNTLNPYTSLLIELNIQKNTWRELFTKTDGTTDVSSGQINKITNDAITIAEHQDQLYGRLISESISRVTLVYYLLLPGNAGNTIRYWGTCTKSNRSIPENAF